MFGLAAIFRGFAVAATKAHNEAVARAREEAANRLHTSSPPTTKMNDITTTTALPQPPRNPPLVSRRKRLYIDWDELTEALTTSLSQKTPVPEMLKQLVLKVPLPEGLTVLAVHSDHARRAFVVTVAHPSFEEVPEYMESPEIEIEATYEEAPTPLPLFERLNDVVVLPYGNREDAT
jgi:hypothetical protein